MLPSISAHDKKDPLIHIISSLLPVPSKTHLFPAFWSQSLIMLTLRWEWLKKQCPSSYGHLYLRGFLLTCTNEYLLIKCDRLGDWKKRSLWKNLYNITSNHVLWSCAFQTFLRGRALLAISKNSSCPQSLLGLVTGLVRFCKCSSDSKGVKIENWRSTSQTLTKCLSPADRGNNIQVLIHQSVRFGISRRSQKMLVLPVHRPSTERQTTPRWLAFLPIFKEPLVPYSWALILRLYFTGGQHRIILRLVRNAKP